MEVGHRNGDSSMKVGHTSGDSSMKGDIGMKILERF